MQRALDQARTAALSGEVPVGAVLMGRGGELLAEAGNACIRSCDPSAHAEMLAIRRAAERLGNYRLPGCTLFVTLEPCIMCAGVCIQARIARIVYGADDPRARALRLIYTPECWMERESRSSVCRFRRPKKIGRAHV